MLYKLQVPVNEIPPLFVQLDKLEQDLRGEFLYWKEKARWIRFEERAEDVMGRWSKPHVATIPQTAIDELKSLLQQGTMIFDLNVNDMKQVAGLEFDSKCFYFKSEKSQVYVFWI
jgi:hypothetical protein